MRDLGGLESALARPHAAFGDTEFYPEVFTKAAVLMDGLTRNHAFIDGNKRISVSTAVLFLQMNGYRLTATNPERPVNEAAGSSRLRHTFLGMSQGNGRQRIR